MAAFVDHRVGQILDAALQEFSAAGYTGARMDDIALRAGLSKGGLYAHFASKEEVFEALLARYLCPPRLDARALELVEAVGLSAFAEFQAVDLPYGRKRALEIATTLALDPEMMLLDEPMAGMNVEEKQDMCRFILDVNDEFGTTIVLIEHDMGVVMDISDRVVVLDYGKKIGDGSPDEVRNNEDVISAYLGTSH